MAATEEEPWVYDTSWNRVTGTGVYRHPTAEEMKPEEEGWPSMVSPTDWQFHPDEAGWDSFWSQSYDDNDFNKIQIFQHDDGRFMVIFMTFEGGADIVCANLGEAMKMIREIEATFFAAEIRLQENEVADKRHEALLEQVTRIANAVWEISNDNDSAYATLLGTPHSQGQLTTLTEAIEGVGSSVGNIG